MTAAPAGGTQPGRVYGVVIGQVATVGTGKHLGEVEVTIAALGDGYLNWAPVAAPMAGHDRGLFVMPEVGDEAVIMFEQGDVSFPIVIGFLWNGKDETPSTAPRERVIRSLNGHTIRLIDSTPTPGGNKGAVVVEDAAGSRIVLADGKVTISSRGILELQGTIIQLTSSGLTRIVSPTGNTI